MINIIENVQRRATRQVEGFLNKTYIERLEDMKLPTLKYRRYRGDMIECYKLLHGLYDNEIINNFLRFLPNDRQYLFRGHRFNLPKEHFKKDMQKFSFRCRITNQWNNLPEKIVDATNINVFKNRLDDYWEKEGLMYDPEVDIYPRKLYRRAGIAT